MYVDEDGFVGRTFELGNGWFYRIDPPSGGSSTQRHIHVWKSGWPEYSQNADGSPHDGLEGTPPKWVRKKLSDMKKWEWKDKRTVPNPSPAPKPTPSLSPTPPLMPSPAPAPAPLPFPKRETKKQQNYSPTTTVNWRGLGVAGFLAGALWLGVKLAAAPYTGGLSLALP